MDCRALAQRRLGVLWQSQAASINASRCPLPAHCSLSRAVSQQLTSPKALLDGCAQKVRPAQEGKSPWGFNLEKTPLPLIS